MTEILLIYLGAALMAGSYALWRWIIKDIGND